MVAEIVKPEIKMVTENKTLSTTRKKYVEGYQNTELMYWENMRPKYITWAFYKGYTTRKPKLDTLGLTTYLRTYSRYIPEIRRREKWCECVLRVVEYSMGLDNREYVGKKLEAEQLYDAIYNLKTFPAGRTLWTGGTKQTAKDPSTNWNCCATVINNISCFSEIFYWLMIGAGQGFNVSKEYVEELTGGREKYFSPEWYIVNHYNDPNNKTRRKTISTEDETEVVITTIKGEQHSRVLNMETLKISDQEFEEVYTPSIKDAQHIRVVVGDSKEGWANTLRFLLHIFKSDVLQDSEYNFVPRSIELEIDYSWVRKKGERIKTFGGRASGYEALKEMLHKIYVHLMLAKGMVSSQLLLDLVTTIGQCVVAGGVRRTSLISFSDVDDKEFKSAKYNLWTDAEKVFYRKNRVMSNNSVSLLEKPSKGEFMELFEYMKSNGEPGLSMLGNAQKYDPGIKVFNPCHEAGLNNKQSCNLTTNNVEAFVYELHGHYCFNWAEWFRVLKLNTRMGVRVTLANQWHPEWDRVQKSQRLLGVSMTGVETARDLLGWTDSQLAEFLTVSKTYAEREAKEYAEELGIPVPARVCLVKPEGTISTVTNVSAGLHRDYAPYYIRRVRFAKNDPLAIALRNIGMQPKPENSQGDDLDNDLCDTWVYSFPVAKPACTKRAIDESAIDQFNRYLIYQRHWVSGGHNASVTISVDKDEWESLAEEIYNNYDDVVGVSTLPKFDPSIEFYPQMPYEPITKEEYEKMFNSMPNFTEDYLLDLISELEHDSEQEELDILEDACATGSCPIR